MRVNKKLIGFLMCVSIIVSCKSAYAASSKSSSSDSSEVTPGFTQEEIQKSKDWVDSFTNTFIGSDSSDTTKSATNNSSSSNASTSTNTSSNSDNPVISSKTQIVSVNNISYDGNSFWALTSDGKWMLIENNSPTIGWKQVGYNWYYMNADGIMQTGWMNVGGNWYYLNSNGAMAYNTIIDGYRLNSNGAFIG